MTKLAEPEVRVPVRSMARAENPRCNPSEFRKFGIEKARPNRVVRRTDSPSISRSP